MTTEPQLKPCAQCAYFIENPFLGARCRHPKAKARDGVYGRSRGAAWMRLTECRGGALFEPKPEPLAQFKESVRQAKADLILSALLFPLFCIVLVALAVFGIILTFKALFLFL